MSQMSKDKPVFGDGTRYKKKGDRCSCICDDPKNHNCPCAKNARMSYGQANYVQSKNIEKAR